MRCDQNAHRIVMPMPFLPNRPDGTPQALDYLCDSGDSASMDAMFQTLTSVAKFPAISNTHVAPANGFYTRPPVVHRNELSNSTLEMLCQAYAVDYCCFDFPTPLACDAAAMERRCVGGSTHANANANANAKYLWQDEEWEPKEEPHLFRNAAAFVEKNMPAPRTNGPDQTNS